MRTSAPSAMNQTVPAALLPRVGCSVVATYDGGAGVAQPKPISAASSGRVAGCVFIGGSGSNQADR